MAFAEIRKVAVVATEMMHPQIMYTSYGHEMLTRVIQAVVAAEGAGAVHLYPVSDTWAKMVL